MIDTDKYPNGPDDERLMPLSKRELRSMVWAYGCELRGLREDSSHTDAYTLAEVKRLRGIIDYIRDTGRMERTYGPLLSIMEKVLSTEEYL